MKTLSIFIILLFYSVIGSSQNTHRIDSLKNVIADIESKCPNPCDADTGRIKAYNEWYNEIYMQMPDSARHIELIAKEIANNLLKTQPSTQVVNITKRYLAATLYCIAYIDSHQGENHKALENYTKSLNIKKEIGDKQGIAKTYNSIGFIYNNQGDLSKALEYYFKSLEIVEEIGDKKGMALSFNNIGYVYEDKGDIPKALEYIKKALKVREEIGDKKGMASSYNNIGYIYDSQGDIFKALAYYNKSLNICKEIGSKYGMVSLYNNIAYIYDSQGDIPKALDYFGKSLSIGKEIGYKRGIANSYNNIGTLYHSQGDISKALEYFNKSLSIAEKIGDKIGMAKAFHHIGSVYNSQGDLSKALEYFLKSMNILEKIGHKEGMAHTYNNIGYIYDKQGDISKALDYYNKSLKIFELIEDKKGVALSFNNIGHIYDEKGSVDMAMEYYLKSLDINSEIGYKQGMLSPLNNLGRLNQKQDKIIQFENYANRSYKISKDLGFPESIKKSALLMKDLYVEKKEMIKADTFAIQVVDINNKAVLSNFATLSESGQEKYFNTVAKDYMDFNSYALFRKLSNPAIVDIVYNNTVKNKGLLLKSSTAMRSAILNSEDTLLITNYYKWILLKKRIARLISKGKDTKELEEQTDNLEKELVKGSQLFSDFKRIQSINWRDIQKGLKSDEVSIEFVHFKFKDYKNKAYTKFTDSTLYCALIISPNSQYPAMIPLFEEKELESIIGKFGGNNYNYINKIYGSKNVKMTQESSLYNLIWAPIDNYLDSIGMTQRHNDAKIKVYISPDGLLHKISFPAIAKEQDIYLCDAYDIEMKTTTGKVVNSGQVKTIHESSQLTATLFGGINYDTDSTTYKGWTYLEGTNSETKKIDKILKKGNLKVNYYNNTLATEEEFKTMATNSNILHIATHGFFYPDPNDIEAEVDTVEVVNEIIFRGGSRGFGVNSFVENRNSLMRSGLVFAGANDVWSKEKKNDSIDDGVLTAQEVSNIDMRKTKLVVMSACETGLGDIKGSEGVYGLQRAFKMAGVDYMIMSLWQVPDKETEEFMTRFYKKLVKTKDIKQSFTETQKEMRAKYDSYFWAAFVLIE